MKIYVRIQVTNIKVSENIRIWKKQKFSGEFSK